MSEDQRRSSDMHRAAGLIAGLVLGWGIARSALAARSESMVVLYDGGCPYCRSAVRRLRRWDTNGLLGYMDARDTPALRRRFPLLEPHLREMRVVLGSGAVVGGFDAVRLLATILPRWRCLAPLLYLPGARVPGIAVYRLIARLRPRDGTCTDDVCGLRPPPRDTRP